MIMTLNRLCSLVVVAAVMQAVAGFQVSEIMGRLPKTCSNSALRSSLLDDLTVNEGTVGAQGERNLPPILQDIADERREFEINLGRAMDTLRKDYPTMLRKTPAFDIYHEDISVVDPSGVQLSGLKNYQNSFSFLQTIVGFFYNTSASVVQNRMVYDFARQHIRVSWNAVLVPKVVGNSRNSLYIDGVSIYVLDSKSGKIVEHRVEKMIINDNPVRPPYGVLSALRDELLNPGQRVPAGVGVGVGAMYETN
jgi:hypothetical protein